MISDDQASQLVFSRPGDDADTEVHKQHTADSRMQAESTRATSDVKLMYKSKNHAAWERQQRAVLHT